ncbi:hypothetical protein SUGI_1086820 [Cryptomeria japonica]|nr:hypothetical protein SUGI_1086820 [Cryptomeria japonica]
MSQIHSCSPRLWIHRMSSSSKPPCAACRFLRKKCTSECVFAPYFPPEEFHKFANVHKIFGASNVTKLLNNLEPPQREAAVISLVYEAEARMRDPVYGCVGAIFVLHRQLQHLHKELAAAHSHLHHYTSAQSCISPPIHHYSEGKKMDPQQVVLQPPSPPQTTSDKYRQMRVE